MIGSEELKDLTNRFENLLADLDRLNLPTVAVHIDLALRRLEETTDLPAPAPSGSSDDNG